jgi:hypothetical protein
MAAFDFPSSPSVGQLYPTPAVAGQVQYLWDGEKWTTTAGLAGSTAFVKIAGDVMTGALELPAAAPTLATHAVNKTYADSKVAKAGDTMSGNLTSIGNIQGLNVISSGASVWAQNSASAGTFQFGTSGGTYLTCDGTNFSFVGGALVVYSNIYTAVNSNAGTLYFGSSATKYLTYDGTNFSLSGGPLYLASGALYTHPNFGISNNSSFNAAGVNRAWAFIYDHTGHSFQMCAVHVPSVWAGWDFNITGANFSLRSDFSATKSGGATTWVITSDARIKTVKEEYTTGLDAIAALRPVRYTLLGNHSHLAPSADDKPAPEYDPLAEKIAAQEYIGLVAQEAETALPDCFKIGEGYIDGKKVDDMRSAEYTPLIFALVNAVKELKARIEALEAGGG